MKLNAVKVTVYAVVAVTALVVVYLYNADYSTFDSLTKEDGVFEWLEFVLLAGASLAMFVAWGRQRFRNVFTLGFALLFLVVAGEEISWGERIWGSGTANLPGSSDGLNVQGELNLHNIEGVHQVQRLVGTLMFLGIAFAMPLAYRYWPAVRQRLFDRFDVPCAPLWVIPIGLVALLFQVFPRVVTGGAVFGLDETGELLTYVVFFIFGLHTLGSTLVPVERTVVTPVTAPITPSA